MKRMFDRSSDDNNTTASSISAWSPALTISYNYISSQLLLVITLTSNNCGSNENCQLNLKIQDCFVFGKLKCLSCDELVRADLPIFWGELRPTEKTTTTTTTTTASHIPTLTKCHILGELETPPLTGVNSPEQVWTLLSNQENWLVQVSGSSVGRVAQFTETHAIGRLQHNV